MGAEEKGKKNKEIEASGNKNEKENVLYSQFNMWKKHICCMYVCFCMHACMYVFFNVKKQILAVECGKDCRTFSEEILSVTAAENL